MNGSPEETGFLRSAVLRQAGLARKLSLLPHPASSMTGVRDFTAGLARAGKHFEEIKNTVIAAYGDQALSKSAIYKIMKKVKAGEETADQRYKNPKKTKRTGDLIAAVAAAVSDDRRLTIAELAAATGASTATVFRILTEELGLVKKSARWVPKLLNEDQKMERVRICRKFVAAVRRRSMSMLDCIVTMDETMVSYHTPTTKRQSMQWIPKGQPGPIKAKVQASRTKQMVLAFFDSRGLIYTNIVPRGTPVNAAYIVKALAVFWKKLKKKRPQMAAGDWFFHWDNAPVHTAAIVQDWLAAREVQVLPHPPYSPDLAPADFFFFPKMKEELAGRHLDQKSFKKAWDGVASRFTEEDFAAAFRRWFERSEKCVQVGGNYVEKC